MSAPQTCQTSVNVLTCGPALLLLYLPKIGLLYWFSITTYFAW